MREKHTSIVSSIANCKCPRCRKGELFEKKGFFTYKDLLLMNDSCGNCKLKFELEPGFWIGSLYASYPFVVIIGVPFILLALFSEGYMVFVYTGIMLVLLILLRPLMIRLGRSLWIHLNVGYNKY
jgi:uncharacterized protein (DUF983 family)